MEKFVLFALMCLSLSLISCDKIKDATSKDFKVNDVSFDFTAVCTEGTTTKSAEAVALRAAATQSFTVTRAVNISELGSDVIDYAGKIKKVSVENSLISVTANPAGAYTIENLTVKATGVSGSIEIPSFTIGNPFPLTSGMNVYTISFINQLISINSVSVTVTGMTDAPAGTTLNISYKSDLIMTASVL